MATPTPTPHSISTSALLVFLVSLVIYLITFAVAAAEYRYEKPIYDRMCRVSHDCWQALTTIWILVISFGVFSFLASFVAVLAHGNDHRLKHHITRPIMVLLVAMWLVVIVVGWVPPNISFVPGHIGLPAWGREGNSWVTSYRGDGQEPKAGMFHYAVAWYQTAILDRPSTPSSAFSSMRAHGQTALAAVIFSTFSFVWSVLSALFVFLRLRNTPRAEPIDSSATKERSESV